MTGDGRFGILFVCTGNLCRSPFAEVLTRHLLVTRLGATTAARFSVSSAGTDVAIGTAMHPSTRAELWPWGLDGRAATAAAQLDAETIGSADLVLTADRGHRSAVVELHPAALATTFCLREFIRLLAGVDPERLPADPVARAAATVTEAGHLRGTLSYTSPADDAVPDPAGLPPHAHRVAAGLIAPAVRVFVELLAAGPTHVG